MCVRMVKDCEGFVMDRSMDGECAAPMAQRDVEREEDVEFEEKKVWQVQKEELEKELYDCTKAHKMSILQSAYEMSKLQVSFVYVKRQESLAKEKLEDALGVVHKLQAKVERLNVQLCQSENKNKRLNSALSDPTLELQKKTVETWTQETAPLIAQHEMEVQQLQKIERNMAVAGHVTDQNVLGKWTLESEVQELKQKLETLESESKQRIEAVNQEKEELVVRLQAATKELLECKSKIAETELHDAELGRYAQVLNVEKITLMGQLELLRAELDTQKEAARIAQIEANKVMESERERAKAVKLVEEKEEEMEYFMKQLESLREKNSMLRTQLDMEQQCKEAEMAAVPKLTHEQSMNLLSRNLNTSMELVASNSVQNPQKMPFDPLLLEVPEVIPEAVETKKSFNDSSRCERSGKGKGKPAATEVLDEIPNPEPNAELQQPPTNLPMKRSSRLRNRVNTQHSTDSASATTGVRKPPVIELDEEEYDENDGVIEDVTQTNRKSVSRLKRPQALIPTETDTTKKKGRKKYLNARSTDGELGLAHLLVGREKNLSNEELRRTPLRSSNVRSTPRTSSRLPR